MLKQRWSWNEFLPFIELTSNNSFHSSIDMAPYKTLYGRAKVIKEGDQKIHWGDKRLKPKK